MRKYLYVVLVMLVPALPGLAQAAVPAVTLQECIDSALANGPDNRILQAGLEVSRSQFAATAAQNGLSLRATLGYNHGWSLGDALLARESAVGASGAQAGALPQAGLALAGPLTSVSLNAYPYVPPTAPTTATTSVLGLSVSQTLWNGYPGGTGAATVEKARIALQVRELATEAGRLNLVYQIRQAYFTMLTAQDNVALQKEILQRQQSLLRQFDALYQLKQASEVDLKTAEVNVRTAQADLDGYVHALRMAGVRLANLMGRPPDQAFSVTEVQAPQAPTQSLEQAVADGLAHRTDIRQVELNRRSLAVDLALVRGQKQPSVDVLAGLNGTVDWSGNSGWLVTAGVRLGIPVLDSGAARSLRKADEQQDQLYALQEQQLRSNIAADIEDAYGSLRVALERVQVAQMNAETLDLQFQVLQIQNRYGTATNQDLLTAAVNAANGRTALAGANSAAQLAALKLLNVMGY
jgi:outer membrane protein